MTDLLRVAAVGDVHCTKTSEGTLQPLFAQMAECADVIALCGDLVDYGLPDEAHVLARELGGVVKANMPVVAVLGNHDFEGGQPEVVKQILCDAGIIILDGDAVEIKGVGFAGTKGFCGGDCPPALQPGGEPAPNAPSPRAPVEGPRRETAAGPRSATHPPPLPHYPPHPAT